MFIQRETAEQADAIRAVTAAAFAHDDRPGETPAEAVLVDELRACDGWLPELSLVALAGESVIGHVVCSRATCGPSPVLGLGPLSVDPGHQGRGVGQALVHAVLGAADALGEPLVILLGSPAYYSRFGFRLAREFGITPPDPRWREHFQARALTTYSPALRGSFKYAEPFDRV